MTSCVVVIRLEVGQLPFEIPGISEQDVVEELAPHRPNQAFDEGVRQGHVWHGLDLVDLQDPQVRRPPVHDRTQEICKLKGRGLIGFDVTAAAR